jgi:hypothetical protein
LTRASIQIVALQPLDTEDALDEIAALRPVAFTWEKSGD